MIRQFFKFLINKVSCASISGAQGILMSKFSPYLLESANMELTDSGVSMASFLTQLLDLVAKVINTWVYIIAKYILMFIDFCQVITYKIAGIDNDLEKIVDLPLFKLLLNENVLKVIGTVLIVGLILLILVTILAIIKSEYEASLENKKDAKVSAYKIVGKSFVSLFLMVLTPFIVVIAIIFSSVMLSSVNNVLNSNGTSQATIGGTLFKTAAYHGNKYRIYAENGQRIPIVLNFDDPYENGTYVFYTKEELAEIYGSWNGKELYDDFARGNFSSFNDTLVYKNGKIYNSNSYTDYEQFVATAEQYYVMADFIDYAISHEITYYIKDSQDNEIDWSRVSSNIKLSDGVYDPVNKTITLTYSDVSNLSPYEDYYTITFDTSSASADSPITNAVATISLILGLNSIVSGNTQKDIGTAKNSSLVGPVNMAGTTLEASAGEIEELMQTLSSTSTNSGVTFRLLERVEGSLNVVRWKTEKALYNGKEYTVYELNKIFKNLQTGINETRATVKVAKKDDSLDSKYYVVSEDVNQFGYYEYTNVPIDFYNDGQNYLDTLTPIFKKATWPQKLYNDLSVIYSDIDFDNYLSYDNWAEALGEYFKTNNNVSSAEVSSFATTLIHPLGLIMAELFLGTTLEGQNGTTSNYSFTSSYLQDVIDSITLSVGGQFDYKNMSYQIDNFIRLFNGQFASVIESLKRIEGFDVNGTDHLSVQGYVYKAYLASIMLSGEYSDYLNEIAGTLLTAEKLIALMGLGANSITYDEFGNPVYKINILTDGLGNYQPLYYKNLDNSGKAVYNKNGEKMYTVNEDGYLSASGDYVPKSGALYRIKEEIVSNGDSKTTRYYYEVYSYSKEEYIDARDMCSIEESVAWSLENIRIKQEIQDKEMELEDEQDPVKREALKAEIAELKASITPEPSTFTTFFETYYTEENGYIYVYEPSDGDTTKDNAVVTKVLYSTDQNVSMAEYFIYEVEKVLDTASSYLTYGELPLVYQTFIDTIISTIQRDVETGLFDEPEYLKFLIEYQEDSLEMATIMGAESISSNVAKEYLANYDVILSNIEFYTEALTQPQTPADISRYYQLLNYEQNKLNKLKKHYIIYGIENYASTQVSAGFTVIVNSHPYNVTQGMTQRELLEIIYGNKLTYSSLIGKLSNNTSFKYLGEFDQNAFNQLSAYVKFYNSKIRRLTEGTVSSCGLFSGKLADSELEIISNYYTIKTGIYKEFTNKSLKSLTSQGKQELKRILSLTASDCEILISNYTSGKTINSGTNYSLSVDGAYKLLSTLVSLGAEGEKLYFVEDNYDGIIDDNMDGFSLLRSFLKDFGDLCFDLARKSNLSTIGEHESENLLDYVDSLIEVLNQRLDPSVLNLGSPIEQISKITSITDLKTISGDDVTESTKFTELDRTSKEYIYTLFDLYEQKVKAYEEERENYKLSRDYVVRFNAGRYAMQADSFVFTEGLKNYLNYFRYNADVLSDTFVDTYVYSGYMGGMEQTEDKIYYYNLYLEAFDGVVLGTSGVYFDALTELQQKVMTDMEAYYSNRYDEFLAGEDEEHLANVNNRDLLKQYIFEGATLGAGLQVKNASKAGNVVDIFKENISLLNLYNLLDYLGLEYDLNKTLGDYRLDALNSLITFTERAGESGASIQARYLTLLYLVCADYTTNAVGETVVEIDSGTKATILKLAGIEGRAEENLVGLTYEVLNTDAISDEKYGSVYIICTYNAETEMYEPFVFASGRDTYGTPTTSYYASEDGSIKYYPVIAKGIIDENGLPTAIREVNGYIEFYRETVGIKDAGALGLDMYYMSVEDVAINYNPINVIVNLASSLLTGKSLAEHIMDSIPVIISSKNMNFAYGTTTDYVYHLENGQFTLNYMFYTDSGISMPYLFDASQFNTLILLFGTIVLAIGLISAMFGVIRNLYELAIIIIIYPGVLALYPLRDDSQGEWRKQLIDKLMVMLGYVIAINGFFLILNLLQTMDISLVLTEESLNELKNTWLFGKFNMKSVIDTLFTFALFLVAVTLLKTLPGMFSKMAGAGNVVDKGEKTRSLAKVNLEEATYFASGHAVEDMILHKMDGVRGLPLVGSDARAIRREKRQLGANARAVKAYETRLKTSGISAPVVEKATKAYADSLNRQLEAERQRRNADREARNARIAKRRARIERGENIVEKEHYPDPKEKVKICPNCRTRHNGKSDKCKYCGHKL